MSDVNVTKIKVNPSDLVDLVDMARALDRHAELKRCPGGRLIARGYVCPHCGEDPTVIHERNGKRFRKCGQSKTSFTEEVIKDPEAALVAVYPVED